VTEIVRCADRDELARRAAPLAAAALEEALARSGRAALAVSGGTTPAATHELLAREAVMREAVDVWFVDERCVPPDDEESNFLLAERTLLEPAGVAAERVHRMRGELGPDEGAGAYRDELAAALGSEPTLDLALVGIGPDGHTASLFPDAPQLAEVLSCLAVYESPKPPPERITLSLPVLRRARACILLVAGADKADAVAAALAEPSRHVPASLLARERLTIVGDTDALAAVPRT